MKIALLAAVASMFALAQANENTGMDDLAALVGWLVTAAVAAGIATLRIVSSSVDDFTRI